MRLRDFLEKQATIWEDVWEAKDRPLEELNITLTDEELRACEEPSIQELPFDQTAAQHAGGQPPIQKVTFNVAAQANTAVEPSIRKPSFAEAAEQPPFDEGAEAFWYLQPDPLPCCQRRAS